jgi:predicted dithiol-disulfide oxidoreductase (DUF899 family)
VVEARKQYLTGEKKFTKARDELSAARRDHRSWSQTRSTVQGPRGRTTLDSLFEDRGQP